MPVTSTTSSRRTPRAIISRFAWTIVALARIVAAATWRKSVITSIAGESRRTGFGPTIGGWTTTPGRMRFIAKGL